MDKNDLDNKVKILLQGTPDIQELANLLSPEVNWRMVDKNILIPQHIGLKQEDCPFCFESIRLVFDKFTSNNSIIDLVCPHCKATLKMRFEFLGYTCDVYLEE